MTNLPAINITPKRTDLSHILAAGGDEGLDISFLHGLSVLRNNDNGHFNYSATKSVAPTTDQDSAEVLARYFNNELVYLFQTGEWRLWDGRVYTKVSEASLAKMVTNFANILRDDIDKILQWCQERAQAKYPDTTSKEYTEELGRLYNGGFDMFNKYVRFIRSSAGQENLLRTLKRVCSVNADLFDTDLSIYVVNNGVIDLEQTRQTGSVVLLAHDSARMVTQYAPVDYVPGAASPAFLRYLETSIPDAEVREYLQRWAGQAMLGKPMNKGFLNLKGPKDSGKSLFENVILRIHGTYATVVEPKVFMKSKNDTVFDLHEVKGRRFVLTSEPPAGQFLDDNVLKSFTGNDMKKTRTLYGKPVSWKPQCTIFIASNHTLRYDAVDEAMGQRAKIINFPNKFYRHYVPGKQMADLDLEEKIMAEAPGVLNWFLDGLLAYFSEGLGSEPISVDEQRQEAETEMDTRAGWFQWALDNDVIQEIPDAYADEVPMSSRLKASDAYRAYKFWCEENGHRPYTATNFGTFMQRHTDKKTSNGVRYLAYRPGEEFNAFGASKSGA